MAQIVHFILILLIPIVLVTSMSPPVKAYCVNGRIEYFYICGENATAYHRQDGSRQSLILTWNSTPRLSVIRRRYFNIADVDAKGRGIPIYFQSFASTANSRFRSYAAKIAKSSRNQWRHLFNHDDNMDLSHDR